MNKKIPTILVLILLFAGIGFGVFIVNRQKSKVSVNEVVPREVRVTNVSDRKFVVSWITTNDAVGSVEYKKFGDKESTVAPDDRDSGGEEKRKTHYVTIDGLQPDTKYEFKILSGDSKKKLKFDNDGTPYTVKTGPIITKTPTAEAVYGKVDVSSSIKRRDAIVYVEIPGANPSSTLVNTDGSWTVPISITRMLDLGSYVQYDSDATKLSITITDGRQKTKIKALSKFAKPTPKVSLGRNYEFLNDKSIKSVAKKSPTPTIAPSPSPSSGEGASGVSESSDSAKIAKGQVAETPKVFNIEPISDTTTASSSGSVTVTTPIDGEVISTNLPEFKGTGPTGITLSISLTSLTTETSESDTTTIDTYGDWSWSPSQALDDGDYELFIQYIDDSGNEMSITRNFTIDSTSNTPAFEASGSAVAESDFSTPEPSPATYSTQRVSMPATDSGVPVSGTITQTIMVLALGLLMVFGGSALLK